MDPEVLQCAEIVIVESNSDSMLQSKKTKTSKNEATSECPSKVFGKHYCKFCPKVFAHDSSLSRHQKLHAAHNRVAFDKSNPNSALQLEENKIIESGAIPECSFKIFSKLFPCPYCPRRFSHSSSLSRHKRECTGPPAEAAPIITAKKTYICAKCDVQMSARGSFIRHSKYCKGGKSKKYASCFEPSCTVSFYRQVDLIRHLIDEHLQDISIEELTFDTKEKFFEFKKDEEEKYHKSFITISSAISHGKSSYKYFVCNHNAQRRKNNFASNFQKCPARMLVKEDERGRYYVKNIRHHIHQTVAENLQLHEQSSEILDCLGSQVKIGVSEDVVAVSRAGELNSDFSLLPYCPGSDVSKTNVKVEEVDNLLDKLKSDIQDPAVQMTHLPYIYNVLLQLTQATDRAMTQPKGSVSSRKYSCQTCHKVFTHKSSQSRHQKRCNLQVK